MRSLLLFYRLVHFLALIFEIRVEKWRDNQQHDNGKINRPEGKEGVYKDDQATKHPEKTREAMGLLPVGLAVERPWQFDAYRVVLSALGQVIATNDDHNACERHGGHRDGKVCAQRF